MRTPTNFQEALSELDKIVKELPLSVLPSEKQYHTLVNKLAKLVENYEPIAFQEAKHVKKLTR